MQCHTIWLESMSLNVSCFSLGPRVHVNMLHVVPPSLAALYRDTVPVKHRAYRVPSFWYPGLISQESSRPTPCKVGTKLQSLNKYQSAVSGKGSRQGAYAWIETFDQHGALQRPMYIMLISYDHLNSQVIASRPQHRRQCIYDFCLLPIASCSAAPGLSSPSLQPHGVSWSLQLGSIESTEKLPAQCSNLPTSEGLQFCCADSACP